MAYSKVLVNLFLGCCSSAFLMEILVSQNPNCVNLVTFLQFLTIAVYVLVKLRHKVFRPKIPVRQYLILISLYFLTSVANNYVYALHVPPTLHMIIRSASSPASMYVAWYVKNRIPKLYSFIGSIVISCGVATAMYGGATIVEEDTKFLHWCIGVILLLTTLITGAFTGLQQEHLYTQYGKHPEEMMFYTHALPLPLFLTMMPQLRGVAQNLPSTIWGILALNITAQILCAHSVQILSTKESSVTVSFLLSVRKFVSLILSAIVFKNQLTVYHIIGSVLVCIGSCFYFNFFRNKNKI